MLTFMDSLFSTITTVFNRPGKKHSTLPIFSLKKGLFSTPSIKSTSTFMTRSECAFLCRPSTMLKTDFILETLIQFSNKTTKIIIWFMSMMPHQMELENMFKPTWMRTLFRPKNILSSIIKKADFTAPTFIM